MKGVAKPGERRKYPIRKEDYKLLEVIGDGASAIVHKALCLPFNEEVAIKILDFEKSNADLAKISREAQTLVLIDHPNVLNAHCSFVIGHDLWVVMPYMAGGSCLHIMKSLYPEGFEEAVIATVLKEVLKGLEYLHCEGHIHRDVKAGNILVDAHGKVKLGDFGVSAYLFDSGDRQRTRNTFVGTPCWMAPEVMEQRYGYDFKADIWSFGITALELAHGHAPFSSQPPMKVLLMTLNNAPPSLDYRRDKKFSSSFKHMIAMCLVKDPSRRPTAQKLLKQSFFKQARSHDYIPRKILDELLPLGDGYSALKAKEAELIAQKKMLDGEKEEMSQNEYKRGISAWNFDIDELKVQASLIPGTEDAALGKESEGCTRSLFDLDTLHENLPHGVPFATSCSRENDINVENSGMVQSITDPASSDQLAELRARSNLSDNDCKIDTRDGNDAKGYSNPSCSEIENHMEDVLLFSEHKVSTSCCSSDRSPSFNHERTKQHHQVQNTENCNGICNHNQVGDMPSEAISKASKSIVSSGEDIEEKSKAPIVQQRGRFKVTSEDADLDKVLPTAGLAKSNSMKLEAANEREKGQQ